MLRSVLGYTPITPGSRTGFKRRALLVVGLFLALSFALHLVMGPTLTTLAPLFRTPEVPDQALTVVTLSRAKLVVVEPTHPPPMIEKRTIANLSPLKYLEIAANTKHHEVHTPARRTAMLSVHDRGVPSPAPGPDSGAATNDLTTKVPPAGRSAQVDSGANTSRVGGAVQWGDDNPPHVLQVAALSTGDTNRHVRLEVEISPDGDVLSVRILASSGDSALDAAAVDAARHSTYAPATLNGLPVHGTCIIDFPSSAAGTT